MAQRNVAAEVVEDEDVTVLGPDGERVKMIRTSPAQISSLDVVDMRDGSEQGAQLLEKRVEVQAQMLRIALKLTSPSQWTVFRGKDGGHDSVYPMGGAADTILRRVFGCSWREKTVRIATVDGIKEATATALLCQGERPIEVFEGKRKMGGFVRTEADLVKGALENMKSVAVRDLLGLRGRTPEELASMGLDVRNLKPPVEFQSHGRDPDEQTVPFGKHKGKLPSVLDDRTLEWFVGAAQSAIDDPEKAKWRVKNQAWLDALLAEQLRRNPEPGAE